MTERHPTPEDWLNPAFDLTEVIRTLSRVGAVTVPGVLRDTGRQQLMEQTVRLPFTDQPAVVGPYGVQQHYAAVTPNSRWAVCFASSGAPFRRFWSSTWSNCRARLSPARRALPTPPCTVTRPARSASRCIGTAPGRSTSSPSLS
jgi:hypothetical protein